MRLRINLRVLAKAKSFRVFLFTIVYSEIRIRMKNEDYMDDKYKNICRPYAVMSNGKITTAR